MSQFVNGYIKDLSAVKDNVKLRVRVLRAWMQPVYGKPHVINMELILADEQANVIGRVIACDDLDCYDKNGKAGKKKPITLIDAENIEMRCTLWGAFAQQFSDFLQKCDDHSNIIAVLNLAMMKMWDSKMGVQNGYNATRLFLFNGKDEITASEFKDVEEFRQGNIEMRCTLWGAFAQQFSDFLQKCDDHSNIIAVLNLAMMKMWDYEMSENTANRISTASRNSTKEDFTTSATMRHIVELLDVPQGNPSVIVGTVYAINEEEGWWYLGCGKCKKKVVKASDIVDVGSETPGKQVGGPTEWYCTKCLVVVQSLKSVFRLQVRVQDATGTCSLSLFNDEVQAIADRSAYQLCDKYGKTDSEFVPPEITKIVGTKFAFKVFMDKFNATKLLPVFNVLRMSADPAIIESLHAAETPVKADNEATSGCVPAVSPFELESQTDDNTTPTNADKSGGKNKRAADDEAEGSMSSNVKKTALEIKVEKEP
ncbi:nucleic acid-binding, OB-fold, Replication protein A, OB domain protein [Artemisia annua]|uniref:Nucleic acid-binding, OB-fold, Replication protein A, OB domain protein n=1 Tax=Artemisia annua TaxID=35608 RepID=A0A2U1Q1V8_ARTAN|nr:nucleic acid-binding, OB-fold, Replication protein A, OB domain protein [Artemisia annua]